MLLASIRLPFAHSLLKRIILHIVTCDEIKSHYLISRFITIFCANSPFHYNEKKIGPWLRDMNLFSRVQAVF